MKVIEKNFSEIYKKVCLLESSELVKKINLRDVFDYPSEENLNGFVTYAFVNLNHEFVFEILAGANVRGEKIKIFPASYKKNIFFGIAEVQNIEIKILSEEYQKAFQDKIQVIDDKNKVDETLEKIRSSKFLDKVRHPQFPDDVTVLFYKENLRPEYTWVRCEDTDGTFVTGKLLNNLQQDFGYKVGDKIKFGVTKFEEDYICVPCNE